MTDAPAASVMLTARQVAERLQLAHSTVRFYAVTGKLPAVRLGKHWRFPAEKVEALIEGRLRR